MDANRGETRSHGAIMTRRRALGMFTGGLIALTLRQVSAQEKPLPTEPEPEPPVTPPAPTVITIYVPVAPQRKPRKPRKRRGTGKRH